MNHEKTDTFQGQKDEMKNLVLFLIILLLIPLSGFGQKMDPVTLDKAISWDGAVLIQIAQGKEFYLNRVWKDQDGKYYGEPVDGKSQQIWLNEELIKGVLFLKLTEITKRKHSGYT